ncbi:MAG: hypothetical protein BWY83_03145 [bacterium ADurb.Bin478]|nr:MAG: hypothetical protein BWY83_03145 [bacterium ADurb.Bin478]
MNDGLCFPGADHTPLCQPEAAPLERRTDQDTHALLRFKDKDAAPADEDRLAVFGERCQHGQEMLAVTIDIQMATAQCGLQPGFDLAFFLFIKALHHLTAHVRILGDEIHQLPVIDRPVEQTAQCLRHVVSARAVQS